MFGDASKLSVVMTPRSRRAALVGGGTGVAAWLAACGGDASPTTNEGCAT